MPTVNDLLQMSHAVGAPALDAAILGEGNTSVVHDDGTFSVKGSGSSLVDLTAEQTVQLHAEPILTLLAGDQPVAEDALSAVYQAAKVDQAHPRRPSVETVFHAALLQLPGVTAVAHTHPTAVNAHLCSPDWADRLAGRLCPDEAVVLGPESVFVPYVDPGVELARAIVAGVEAFRAEWQVVPKVVYMQNHGLIAIATSPKQAVDITAMAIKAARMRTAALSAGEQLNPLGASTVAHLLGRPDEQYRIAMLAGQA